MASLVVTGTHLEREYTEKSGTTLGKPVHPHLTRVFSLGAVAPGTAVDEAARFARARGWTPETSRPTSFSGTRRIDAIRAELLVTVADDEGADTLYLYLTAF